MGIPAFLCIRGPPTSVNRETLGNEKEAVQMPSDSRALQSRCHKCLMADHGHVNIGNTETQELELRLLQVPDLGKSPTWALRTVARV